jgi:hypothetical protein
MGQGWRCAIDATEVWIGFLSGFLPGSCYLKRSVYPESF